MTQPRVARLPRVVAMAKPVPGTFDIGAAPMLIPEGPWKVMEGNCASVKGFRRERSQRSRHRVRFRARDPQRDRRGASALRRAAGMSAGLRKRGDKADLALVRVLVRWVECLVRASVL